MRGFRWILLPILIAALSGDAFGTDVPPDKQTIKLDYLPTKLGAVEFSHLNHSLLTLGGSKTDYCKKCHHLLEPEQAQGKEPGCTTCHVELGQPERVIDGKRSPALARLKPNGAIDHRSILFHTSCVNQCHRATHPDGKRLYTCKTCHERGIGLDILYGKVDLAR